MTETALVEVAGNEMAILRDPKLVLDEARNAAAALKAVIANKARPVMFNGKQYLEFEDWQTAGQFYGYVVETGEAVPIEIDGIKGAKASAKLYNKEGREVGGAESFCMRDEPNWKTKPWFQLASMAQTRAGSKAFRNRLAWFVVLAGYAPTPAEEIDQETFKPKPVMEQTNTAPFDQGLIISDILEKLAALNGADEEKMNAHLKTLTTWKAKETNEVKFLTMADLPRVAKSKNGPAWIKSIQEKIIEAYKTEFPGA